MSPLTCALQVYSDKSFEEKKTKKNGRYFFVIIVRNVEIMAGGIVSTIQPICVNIL